MNVGLVVLASLAILLLGMRGYSRLVGRAFGVDPARATPATVKNDGVDYVPTQPVVLFGHHFASIAAAGPIVGPTLALAFGFGPVWLWIVLGVVLIGAVHDFAALFIAVREGGQSVAEVARRTLGRAGFLLYAAFAVLLCVLVSAAFLDLTAKSLTALYPLDALGLAGHTSILSTVTVDGVEKARIGGVASTSVIVITAAAPLLGWLLYKKRLNGWLASAIALVACAASIWLGLAAPIGVDPKVWSVIILAYTLGAGYLPVWLLLQPRDFVNVQLLYVGLCTLVIAVLGCGLRGVVVDVPFTNLAAASDLPGLGAVWPFLFVTIACGSVSGAHGLICGGTTCKQLASEKHARLIGYGSMLLEGLLAICVVLVIAAGLGFDGYMEAVWSKKAAGAPVAFAVSVGRAIWKALGSPDAQREIIAYGTVFGIILLEGFLVTTIDTVVRLSRYLVEESLVTLLGERVPRVLRNRGVTTGLVLVPIALLAFTSGYRVIWPLFGASNQLLAALTLIAASLWLWRSGRNHWYTALPAAFMTVTTLGALVTSLADYLGASPAKLGLAATAMVLIALTLCVFAVTAREILRARRGDGEAHTEQPG